ncbi:hypothetical protein HanRHA438_Chr02g0056251 [Helianthus annuus]|nr:hypothetical protein HanRHA438_Chr02g0056251 [Helianthus annuus]
MITSFLMFENVFYLILMFDPTRTESNHRRPTRTYTSKLCDRKKIQVRYFPTPKPFFRVSPLN